MIHKKLAAQEIPAGKDLKRTFERAVRDIYEVGLTGKASSYRTPIVQRFRPAKVDSSRNAEKQAVSDAAKALSQLWKVAPSSGR